MSAAAIAPSWPAQKASALLDRLQRELRRAAKRPDADAVHDVRVAIRRLRQCLTAFEPIFPPRVSKNIEKKLRKTLDAAGDLRNLDIAIELLKNLRLAGARPLLVDLRKERNGAEKRFVRALAKLAGGDIAGWQAELNAAPPCGPMNGSENLSVMASEFFSAGDLAAAPMASPKTHHKFRIKTKKFRYTLELFAPLDAPALNAMLRVLRNIQQRLGSMNDYAVTSDMLRERHKRHPGAAERAVERLSHIAENEALSFRRYWRRSLPARQKGEWVRVLSGIGGA